MRFQIRSRLHHLLRRLRPHHTSLIETDDDVMTSITDLSSLTRTGLTDEGAAIIRAAQTMLDRIRRAEECNDNACINDARNEFEAAVARFLDYLDKCAHKTDECEQQEEVLPIEFGAGYLDRACHPNQEQPPQKASDDDEEFIKSWLLHEKVVASEFVSRGAFGKVYKGKYKDEVVAVKTMSDQGGFLAEVKMAAMMTHRNIVNFIGVAWNPREGFCSVMEFMDGGDLRRLLDKYEEEEHDRGFDCDKIEIAFQVIRALAHLHSHKVIHRDLKSRNVLLHGEGGAKLADFGVSRELSSRPRAMTAGVGTALWMAPEVMTGRHYDEKADMFSFGVVLSELSTHLKPYTHVDVGSGGNQQLAILCPVAMGTLHVEFAEGGPESIIELGRTCVSVDAANRPTADQPSLIPPWSDVTSLAVRNFEHWRGAYPVTEEDTPDASAE